MPVLRRFLTNYEKLLLGSRLFCAAALLFFAFDGPIRRLDGWMIDSCGYYLLSVLFLALYGRKQAEKSRLPWQITLVIDLLIVTAMVKDQGGLHSDIYYFYYEAMAISAFLFKCKPALLLTLAGDALYGLVLLLEPGPLDWGTLFLRLGCFYFTSIAFPLLSYMEQERQQSSAESNRLLAEKIKLLEEMEAYNRQVTEYTLNLHNQAVLDPLTQLHNHTYFINRLIVEVEKSKHSGRPLSLVLFDVDNFKRVNDVHGHLIGDQLLVAIAKQIRDMLANTFYVPIRQGGEEMAVLMPDADLEHAYDLAEALRKAISQVVVPLPGGELLHVTTSVGVATFPTMCANHQELIDCADQAMYLAKSNGKNRTCLYAPQEKLSCS